jgi:tRNA dimethylallyltransferase
MNKALIICGPTCSGKSSLAHLLAQKRNGEIVNIDSMQIYKDIPIITASPSEKLKEELPYHLYNFQDIDQLFSSVKYTKLASEVIKEISTRGRLPIIVGGTGMYINSLMNGYSEIPEISTEVKKEVESLRQHLGQEEFYLKLTTIDRFAAERLKAFDKQRTIRAYEVITQTGKSIFEFQTEKNYKPLPEFDFEVIYLKPERTFLYDTVNRRLELMFKNGAIEEVKAVQNLLEANSHIKAVGVQEILGYLSGNISLQEALILAQTRTRQYAKRQITWFNNQIKSSQVMEFSNELEFLKVCDEII